MKPFQVKFYAMFDDCMHTCLRVIKFNAVANVILERMDGLMDKRYDRFIVGRKIGILYCSLLKQVQMKKAKNIYNAKLQRNIS